MKSKQILLLVCILFLVSVIVALPVSAVPTEGSCGDSMTWNFDAGTGTLYISGSGEMDAGEIPVWQDLRKEATALVVGEGVTSISRSAFSGFGKLASVSLPNSLRWIEDYAFSGCPMTNVAFGPNLTYIGDYAFERCYALTSLTIPAGVTEINYGTFSYCSALSSLNLHNGITTIDSYAFNYCSSLTNVVIPNSVTTLGASAFFGCSNLSSFTIGSGVATLDNNVLGLCSGLTNITIPDNVKTIASYAFSDCTALSSVTIGSGVSEIDSTAFNGCNNLSAFVISGGNGSFCTDQGVIYTKNKSELVLFPKGYQGGHTVASGTSTIRAHAGQDCAGITSLVFPESVSIVNDYAFSCCYNLHAIKFSGGLTTIKLNAFSYAAITEIYLPESITIIAQGAFGSCKNLTAITFCGHAPQIDDWAFSEVTATCYYPAKYATWQNAQKLYGGILTWVPLSCNGNHTVVKDDEKKPTCLETGLTAGSHCSVCGEVIVEQKVVPVTEHQFGAWKIVTASTELSEGLSERVCSVCNTKEKKSLPKLEPQETQPKPTQTQPKPTQTQPKPTETQPKPTQTQPKPTETQPKPTETQPKPTETQPKPTETQPKPTQTQSKPTETQPKPTETQPKPTETQPKLTQNTIGTEPVHSGSDSDVGGDSTGAIVAIAAAFLAIAGGASAFFFIRRRKVK